MYWILRLSHGERLEDLRDDGDDVAEAAAAAVEAAQLRAAIRQLPERERAVIALRYGLDEPQQTHRQIARRLGVSPATAYRLEVRALDLLRVGYARLGAIADSMAAAESALADAA